MDLELFLRSLVAGSFAEVATVALVVGGLVFGIIEGLDKLIKQQNPAGLSSNFKFWLAIILSFATPVGAYVVLQLQTAQPVALNGLFLACAVGYVCSQGIHWLTEGRSEAPGGIT